ncbi:hypothetical protein DL240_08660 [Lujinxingia litoralis]|uniref:DAGKc domain-containing protein n=1 Tax=Lujinxingia litoralis TaxID=2211119 RepID=A0A328C7A6_9DELT|nr:hypothetical protein [Lujinxingia litoralis]RAL22952.1 hypothetical protein DL240_08660 [Lujinxingia litoralis]
MVETSVAVLSGGFFLDDARAHFGAERVSLLADDLQEVAAQLGELVEQGVQVAVIYGDDVLLGRVVSACLREVELAASGLRLWPCAPAGVSTVADAIGAALKPGRAARLLEQAAGWQAEMVPTLKVSASTEAGALYGFSFGAGWVYRAQQARKQSQQGASELVSAMVGLASDTLRETQGTDVAARMRVDQSVVEMHQGSVVATTLGRTWFGLRHGGPGPAVWPHIPTRALVRQGLKPELLEAVGEGAGKPRELGSLVLDAPAGWTLDGALHAPDPGCALRVSPGPKVALVRPPGRIGKWVSRVLDATAPDAR